MAKFKVGDRVRLLNTNGKERWGKKGEEGTVLIEDDGCDDCLVAFDTSGDWYASWSDLEHVVVVAPATAAPEVEFEVELTRTPAVGDDVLIPGWITGINHSRKGTVYSIAFETKNRRVSLHFLEEDFIAVDEGDCPCFPENDNVPLVPNTAAAFDDLCGSIFGLTMRAA